MQFISLDRWSVQPRGVVWWDRKDEGHLGLGAMYLIRAQAFMGFLHVVAEGLGRVGAVLAVILVVDTKP